MMKEMKNNADAPIYKVRSYLGCLDQGFKLGTRHVIDLLRYLSPSLLSCVFFGILLVLETYFYTLPYSSYRFDASPAMLIAGACVLLVLFVESEGSFMSQLFDVLSKYSEQGAWPVCKINDAKRSSKKFFMKSALFLLVGLLTVALFVLPAVLLLGWHSIYTYLILFVYLLFVLIPYMMMGWDYMLSHHHSLWDCIKRIKVIYQNLGSLYAVWFVAGLLQLFISIVVWLPTILLVYAHRASLLNISMGDTSDLPTIVPVLVILFTIISSFLSKMSTCILFFPLSYLYGSIVTKKKEKMKFDEEEKQYTPL